MFMVKVLHQCLDSVHVSFLIQIFGGDLPGPYQEVCHALGGCCHYAIADLLLI